MTMMMVVYFFEFVWNLYDDDWYVKSIFVLQYLDIVLFSIFLILVLKIIKFNYKIDINI